MENAIGKTPVHLWIIGGLATVWNAFGCYDYLMTRTRNTDYLQSMMPTVDPQEMLAYIDSFPIWAQFGWGLGVWGGLLGSILLLLRNRWAVVALALSLVGALLGIGYQIANPGGPAAMNEGANAIMPYVVIAVALGLVGYARAMKAKGVLN
jgi:hypothetical protein